MNLKIFTQIIFFVFLFIGCHTKKREESQDARHHKRVDLIDFSKITKNEMEKLLKGSKIGQMIIFQSGRTFEFCSDGKLTYSLFGDDNSVQGLQKYYNGIFKIEVQMIKSEMHDTAQKINKLLYRNSFIKTYNNPVTKKDDIVSCRIENEDIILVDGIHVGITKEEFFSKIFKDASKYDFSIVDTVSNNNELKEIEQFYIFNSNKLKKIILKSDYDWIQFDL